jgi:phage baseplate assembly protein W
MAETATFKETSIAFPFSINSSGAVATITDQPSIYSSKVRSVIGTLLKQRVMRPDFGSRLNEVLWNTESYVQNNAQDFIAQAFSLWLPMLSLTGVDVSNINDEGSIEIKILYKLPNQQDSYSVVGIVAVSGNSLSSQEIA